MDLFDMIVLLIVCGIDTFLIFYFISGFSEVRDKMDYKRIILISTAISLFELGINMIRNTYINLFFLFLIYWFYITVIFELNIRRRFFYFSIAYSIAAECEILIPIFSYDTSYYLKAGETPPISDNILLIATDKLVTFIVFAIIKQAAAKPKGRVNYKIFFTYLSLPLSTFGMMVTMVYSGMDISGDYILKAAMTLFLVLMLISNIVIFYVYTKHVEEVEKNMDNKLMLVKKDAELQHLLHINNIYEQHQILAHDVGNYLKIIEELLKSNQVERAGDILKELNLKLGRNMLTEYSNHTVINMLLSTKQDYAAKQGVCFDVYIEPNIRVEQISDIDMIAMLGNLIDNAVRAAERGERKKVSVRIFMQNDMQVLVIKIVNDFGKEPVFQDNRLVSTKEEEGIHGLGIRSVEKTAGKYEGYLECFVKDNKFHAILILPIKKIEKCP